MLAARSAILGRMMRSLRALIARNRPEPVPRANPTRIAVLEHDLLGIHPEPGSMAALAIGIRRAGICNEHKPVEQLTGPRRSAVCAGCGKNMLLNDNDTWELA